MLDWLAWRPLSSDVTHQLVYNALRNLFASLADGVSLDSQYADLGFYKKLKLGWIKVSRGNGEALATTDVIFLFDEERFLILNGTSSPIYDANELATLNLTPDTVVDYVRFFCFFVHGDAGPFLLFESLPPDCSGRESIEQKRQELAAYIQPAKLVERTSSGAFRVSAIVLYDNCIFDAKFDVMPDGVIEMIDDNPLVGDVPKELQPLVPALYLGRDTGDLESVVRALVGESEKEQSLIPESPSQKILETLIRLLLEQALITKADHRLVSHFNARGASHSTLDRFTDLLVTASAVVVIESSIPFVEEVVSQIIIEDRKESPFSSITYADVDPSDETRLKITLPSTIGPALLLVPLHAYRGIGDSTRVAHQIASRDLSVLIGCDRLNDVPDSLREIVDLTLRLPPLLPGTFETLFRRVMGKRLPDDWQQPDTLWLSHVRHTDLEHPCSLNLSPEEALLYIRDRVEERMQTVDPAEGLGLDNLHGLGEARMFAEDLIADIHDALKGRLSWSEVDRGALLAGPPGTGKTTLARAIAKDCGIKFINSSAASWQSAGYLNEHIRAMRNDFIQARRYSPAILFIDEIDSIGSREALSGSNAQYQIEVVNALLEQLQGIDATAPVIVIGATNHPDRIDPALRRAGRLDRVIEIPYPNSEALTAIFEHYLQPLEQQADLAPNVNTQLLGRMAFGMTGADIERIVRGARRRARKANRVVMLADLRAEIIGSPRDANAAPRLTQEEVARIAVHEAGHALARCKSRTEGQDITFVSIIPRADGTLGFVALMPSERNMTTRAEYREYLEIALAGRAAEEIQYGSSGISSGAHDDLRKATYTAGLMVSRYGLGPDDCLLWTEAPSAGHMAQAAELLTESYVSVRDKLFNSRARLTTLAEVLKEKQELTGGEILKIIGRVSE